MIDRNEICLKCFFSFIKHILLLQHVIGFGSGAQCKCFILWFALYAREMPVFGFLCNDCNLPIYNPLCSKLQRIQVVISFAVPCSL